MNRLTSDEPVRPGEIRLSEEASQWVETLTNAVRVLTVALRDSTAQKAVVDAECQHLNQLLEALMNDLAHQAMLETHLKNVVVNSPKS